MRSLVVVGVIFRFCCIGAVAVQGNVGFWPSQSEISPGGTVEWTVEIPDADWSPPFTISLELNNDGSPESSIRTSEWATKIQFTYNTPNIYVPYVTVRDATGKTEKAYSRDVLAVLPSLEPRAGIGMVVPTADNPEGDYIKAVQVLDHGDMTTPKGVAFVQGELDRLARLGVNMVIYNTWWCYDEQTSSVHEPLYCEWPCSCGTGTLDLEDLVKLADWTHARGMRVGLRYFLWQKGKCGGNPRAQYAPADSTLYLRYQEGIKVLYARVAQSLGIELYCLDGENQAFTSNPGVVDLIHQIRQVYDGLLTDGAYDIHRVYDCPFVQELDLVSWSDYYFGTHDLNSANLSQEQLAQIFLEHYDRDVRPVLEHVGKPGLLMELGADFQANGDELGAKQYGAYLSAIDQLQRNGAPICGLCWYSWDLVSEWTEPAEFSPRGRPAENVLADYFTNVFPERVTCDFAVESATASQVSTVLESFDTSRPLGAELWQEGGLLSWSLDSIVAHDGRSLKLEFKPSPEGAQYQDGFFWQVFPGAQDWSKYHAMSLWIRVDEATCCGIEVSLYDWDGDRFTARIDSRYYVRGWQRVSTPFDILTQPDWANKHDGQLDLSRVRKWGIGWFWQDNTNHVMWVDTVCLDE